MILHDAHSQCSLYVPLSHIVMTSAKLMLYPFLMSQAFLQSLGSDVFCSCLHSC